MVLQNNPKSHLNIPTQIRAWVLAYCGLLSFLDPLE